jgi:type I restriction enzyme S subunit
MWATKPLSEIVSIRAEVATKSEIKTGAVHMLDRISFDKGQVFSGKRIETKMKQYKAYKGDIVVSKINARKGAIGVVDSEVPIGSTIHFRVLIPDSSIVLTKFIHLALRSIFCRNQFEILTGGQGKGEISEERLLSVEVPMPPLPIQQKIVTHWDGVNFKTNTDIAISQEIAKSTPGLLATKLGLEALIAPHSKPAFVSSWKESARWGVGLAREMTRRPNLAKSQFPIVSLSNVISDLETGWSPKCLKRPAEDNEWGTLKLGAVSFGWFDENQNKAFPLGLKPKEQYEIKSGDLILIRGNVPQYVGACALVGDVRPKLMLCDLMFRVIWKADSQILPKYLDEILKTPHLRWQIENNLTGTSPTMKKTSKPALMALRFPLPPLDIQETIISKIEAKRKEARSLQDDAEASQQKNALEIENMILGTRPVEAH